MSTNRKFEMGFRRSVGTFLVLTQFCIGSSFAFADSGIANPVRSPEATLIQEAVALQGSNLPQAELKQQFADLISAYLETAPVHNREARLEQALVGMHVMTAQQASALTQRIRSDLKNNGMDPDAELQNLFATPPAGAQFSFCDVLGVTFLSTGAGSLVLAGVSALDHNNQAIDEAAVTLCFIGFTVGMIGVGGC